LPAEAGDRNLHSQKRQGPSWANRQELDQNKGNGDGDGERDSSGGEDRAKGQLLDAGPVRRKTRGRRSAPSQRGTSADAAAPAVGDASAAAREVQAPSAGQQELTALLSPLLASAGTFPAFTVSADRAALMMEMAEVVASSGGDVGPARR
jgi:hypothetical protein